MSISLSCLKSQIKGNDCKVINMTFVYLHGCLGTKCLDSEWKPKTEIRFHYSPGCDSTLSECLHTFETSTNSTEWKDVRGWEERARVSDRITSAVHTDALSDWEEGQTTVTTIFTFICPAVYNTQPHGERKTSWVALNKQLNSLFVFHWEKKSLTEDRRPTRFTTKFLSNKTLTYKFVNFFVPFIHNCFALISVW